MEGLLDMQQGEWLRGNFGGTVVCRGKVAKRYLWRYSRMYRARA